MQKRLRLGKRTLALILVAVMALGLVPVMAAGADYDGHWSKEYIENAVSEGWMKGYEDGTFRPDSSITRAEFAVMLWRVFGEPAAGGANPFTDVEAGTWYAAAATALYERGVTSGVGGGQFDPNGTLTREMGMTMLARAFEIEAQDAYAYAKFADGGSVSDWAAASVSALSERGYVSGVGENMFEPQNALKRGEMAKMLTVVIEGEGIEEGPDAGTITISLSHSPTISTSGNVTITATVTSESGSITYIGSRKSSEGASYTSKTGFDAITTTSKFTVSSNGWYAVCAEDSTGAFAYKLIQITNISSSGGGGGTTPTDPTDPETWKINYHANGATSGTPEKESETVEKGKSITIPGKGTMARTGYTFLGWSADDNATTAEFTVGETITPLYDMDIYAVWKATGTGGEDDIKYTVKATTQFLVGQSNVIVQITGDAGDNYIVTYNGTPMVYKSAGYYQLIVDKVLGDEGTSGYAVSAMHYGNVQVDPKEPTEPTEPTEVPATGYTVKATTQFLVGQSNVIVQIVGDAGDNYIVTYDGASMVYKNAGYYQLVVDSVLGDEGSAGYAISQMHGANVKVYHK